MNMPPPLFCPMLACTFSAGFCGISKKSVPLGDKGHFKKKNGLVSKELTLYLVLQFSYMKETKSGPQMGKFIELSCLSCLYFMFADYTMITMYTMMAAVQDQKLP